jgi:hypothetical protein
MRRGVHPLISDYFTALVKNFDAVSARRIWDTLKPGEPCPLPDIREATARDVLRAEDALGAALAACAALEVERDDLKARLERALSEKEPRL